MTRVRGLLVAIIAAAVVGIGSNHPVSADPSSRPLPEPSQGRCPKLQMQPPAGDAVARAALAALDQAPAVYRGTKLEGVRVTGAILARLDDSGRGGSARVTCGQRVENRTVVVNLEFPAMRPSAGLSQGVVLVSRFADGYRVWVQLH
jgi:hypothetical protein